MTSMIHTSAFNTISAIDQWMKVIGSNVTGATVNGYKGETVHFGQVLEQMVRGPAKATDGYGSRSIEVGAHELWSDDAAAPGQAWTGFRFIDISPTDLTFIRDWVDAPGSQYV